MHTRAAGASVSGTSVLLKRKRTSGAEPRAASVRRRYERGVAAPCTEVCIRVESAGPTRSAFARFVMPERTGPRRSCPSVVAWLAVMRHGAARHPAWRGIQRGPPAASLAARRGIIYHDRRRRARRQLCAEPAARNQNRDTAGQISFYYTCGVSAEGSLSAAERVPRFSPSSIHSTRRFLAPSPRLSFSPSHV